MPTFAFWLIQVYEYDEHNMKLTLMVNELDWDNIVREFKLRSLRYFYFQTNNFRKGINSPISPQLYVKWFGGK